MSAGEPAIECRELQPVLSKLIFMIPKLWDKIEKIRRLQHEILQNTTHGLPYAPSQDFALHIVTQTNCARRLAHKKQRWHRSQTEQQYQIVTSSTFVANPLNRPELSDCVLYCTSWFPRQPATKHPILPWCEGKKIHTCDMSTWPSSKQKASF